MTKVDYFFSQQETALTLGLFMSDLQCVPKGSLQNTEVKKLHRKFCLQICSAKGNGFLATALLPGPASKTLSLSSLPTSMFSYFSFFYYVIWRYLEKSKIFHSLYPFLTYILSGWWEEQKHLKQQFWQFWKISYRHFGDRRTQPRNISKKEEFSTDYFHLEKFTCSLCSFWQWLCTSEHLGRWQLELWQLEGDNFKEMSNWGFYSKHGILLHLFIFPQLGLRGFCSRSWNEEEKW